MGYKNKASLNQQIVNHLNEISRFGESRNEAKKVGEASQYIYSHKTYEDYHKYMNLFADYCKEHHNATSIMKCEQYVPEYVQHLIDEKKSSYTQKSMLSAFRKFYDNRFEDVYTESRQRSQITRGREDTVRARHFSESANAELVDFCRNTGLRRHELENLHGGCVEVKSDGNSYIVGVKGKGGKVRDIRILNNDQAVIDKIMSTSAYDKVWGQVHSAANIHGYRADYAEALYQELARDIKEIDRSERYYCRNDMAGLVLDKQAMLEVSKNLGHNRINIIAQNYLYNL